MNIEESIKQLESLKEHCNSFEDEIWQQDIKAIECIIKEIQKQKRKYEMLFNEYNKRVNDILELEQKVEELENGDLTTVYINGFYDGQKKFEEKIKNRIKSLKGTREIIPPDNNYTYMELIDYGIDELKDLIKKEQ